MRKIVFVHHLSPQYVELVRSAAPGWEVIQGGGERWVEHLRDAEIVVGWSAAAEEHCLKPGAKLRWVQSWGAGVDRMPLDAFAERGIILTNASGVHAYPISETIFAMMLTLARNIHLSIRNQAQRKWQSTGVLGEIHGKTIGIIGVGAIGEETARLAKAFGMNVLGVRRSGESSPFVDKMYDNSGLDRVLQESDYVVVTVPLTRETRHMFGRRQFQMMKPTACFINIGRGETTDTDALIEALTEGTIGGAGLDVFEQEPLPETSPLWTLENVIITPHNSGSTVYYDERATDIFLQNLMQYLRGSVPSVNRVDLEKQY